MNEKDPIREYILSRISARIDRYVEDFKCLTADTEALPGIGELSDLTRELIDDTKSIYNDLFSALLRDIDEKELIRKKKEPLDQREFIFETEENPR